MLDSNKLREQLAIAMQGKDKALEVYHQWLGSISLLEQQIKMVSEQEELARLEQDSREELDGDFNHEGTQEAAQE